MLYEVIESFVFGPNDELEELREENQVILPMETSTAR